MNKRQIIASLNKIANELDATGLYTEANTVTKVMTRIADEFRENYEEELEPYKPEKQRMSEDDADVFLDGISKIYRASEFSNVSPSDKKNALVSIMDYLSSNKKDGFFHYFEESYSYMSQEGSNPKYKLALDIMRYVHNFVEQMKLDDADSKSLQRLVSIVITSGMFD